MGLPKATVLARHLKDIVPEARVEPCVMMYTRQNEDAILGGDRKPDFVIDCIDDMDTKVRPIWRPGHLAVKLDLSSGGQLVGRACSS